MEAVITMVYIIPYKNANKHVLGVLYFRVR